MHCVDETHWDAWGSDKIYIITSAVHVTPDGTNVVTTTGHPVEGEGETGKYFGVDSGETRLGPVASCWSQLVADIDDGMSLTTVVFENDNGDPNYYRDEVDEIVKAALAVASYLFPALSPIFVLLATQDWLTDFFNYLLFTGDDRIGDMTTVLTIADLEDYGRRRISNSFLKGNISFTLPNHFVASVNSNDYFAAFTVDRDPAALYPDPIIE
jgi:hypothetical protein